MNNTEHTMFPVFQLHRFASKDPTRMHLNRVRITVEDSKTIADATDGHRAVRFTSESTLGLDDGVYYAHRDQCKAALKAWPHVPAREFLTPAEGDDDFPPLEQVIPSHEDEPAMAPQTVNPEDLANLWEWIKASKYHKDSCIGIGVRIQLASDELEPLRITAAEPGWSVIYVVMPRRP